MSLTEEIIKAALLGTARYMPRVPEEWGTLAEKINAGTKEDEDRFFRLAATAFLHEEAGQTLPRLQTGMESCPPETQPRVNGETAALIKSLLKANDEVMFRYLMHRCQTGGRVLTPELVPLVLDKALEQKKLSRSWLAACGETGRWLCRLNASWAKLCVEETQKEDIWGTGTFEERKAHFRQIRQTDPAEALALLEKSAAEENAANRLELVEMLAVNLSVADEPFLQTLLKDKSQKVKKAAQQLLAITTGSGLNQKYTGYLLRALSVKEERHLIVSKKTVLAFHADAAPDAELFKQGMEKVSSAKGVDDAVFWAGQALGNIDPEVLANRLGIAADELLKLLLARPEINVWLPYLMEAAERFRHRGWARQLLDAGRHDTRLLMLLDKEERNRYLDKLPPDTLLSVIDILFDGEYSPLPLSVAEKIIRQLESAPYAINPTEYQRLALHTPKEALPLLHRCAQDPGDDYRIRYFKSRAADMAGVIEKRENIRL